MKKIIFITLLLVVYGCSNEQNVQNVQKNILNILNSYSFSEEGEITHKIYDFTPTNSEFTYSIAFTQNSENKCHACGVFMSIFVIDKHGKIKQQYIDVAEIGSWGTFPSKDSIKKYPTNNSFLLTINDADGGQGVFVGNMLCFTPINEKVVLVGIIELSYDNSGFYIDENDPNIETFTANYSFKDKPNSLPDIILNISGKKDGTKYNKKTVYSFNGKEYIEQK